MLAVIILKFSPDSVVSITIGNKEYNISTTKQF